MQPLALLSTMAHRIIFGFLEQKTCGRGESSPESTALDVLQDQARPVVEHWFEGFSNERSHGLDIHLRIFSSILFSDCTISQL